MQLHQLIAKHLLHYDVSTLFGLMGDQNMLYVTDFIEAGGRFVNSAHESTAVSMADGYARFSGRIGVATVTHGPGVTNTLTALTEAARARTPMVLLTGRTPGVVGLIQELDIAAAVTPFGAGYAAVRAAASAPSDIFAAFHQALRESRPVVLDIPADLMSAQVEDATSSMRLPEPQAPMGDESVIEDAVGLLASSRRSVILAGRGAIHSGAHNELVELARTLGSPLATTLLAKDLFKGEPLDLGVFGTLSHTDAIQAIATADTIAAFGASLNPYTTARQDLLRGKRVIQVDTDASRVGRFSAVDVAVIGDARAVVRQVQAKLSAIGSTGSADRWAEVGDRLAVRSPRDDFEARANDDYVDTREAMLRLNEVLPERKNVITDGGNFAYAPWRYLDVEPGHFFHTLHFGSIGLALSAAMGASVGDPSRISVAIVGDGGFMMNTESLNTAFRNDVPVLVVCVNDGSYGAEYHKLRDHDVDPKYALIDWPDLLEVARSLGSEAVRITSLDQLDSLKPRLESLDKPLVVELRVDPDVSVSGGLAH